MTGITDVIVDQLDTREITDECEVELRLSVHSEPILHTIREQLFPSKSHVEYSVSTVQYHDSTDVRSVDGVWQRKRVMLHRKLPCKVLTSLVVSLETAACPPDDVDWLTISRKRWSYTPLPSWRVDFSTSERNSNIEIEYVGAEKELIAGVEQLQPLLADIHACFGFLHAGFSSYCAGRGSEYPFVRMDMSRNPVSRKQRSGLVQLMQKCQPVSLRARSVPVEQPLISLKHDGVRMVLTVRRAKDEWVCTAICRLGMPWLVPCVEAYEELTMDCEYMHSTRTFVVFDLFTQRGRTHSGSYRDRLRFLASAKMPKLACQHSVHVKTFYPLTVVNDEWYEKQRSEHNIDGLVVHDGSTRLGDIGRLYKWKPTHTVDLYVNNNGELIDGTFRPFLKICNNHDKDLRYKDVWECIFVENGEKVRPVRRRTDKTRGNAGFVCREILEAFQDNLKLEDVVQNMSQPSVVRKSKRKRV